MIRCCLTRFLLNFQRSTFFSIKCNQLITLPIIQSVDYFVNTFFNFFKIFLLYLKGTNYGI